MEALYGLPLTHLHIDNTGNKSSIDLSRFCSLERLSLTKPKRNISGLAQCGSLRELCLYNYAPMERDLSQLRELRHLRRLDLVHPRIDSLRGIGELPVLEKLIVAYSKTLRSLDALPAGLKHLEIDHCPGIETFVPVGSLCGLEMLFIRACKTMDTRSFLGDLKHLKHAFISKGTVILDEC